MAYGVPIEVAGFVSHVGDGECGIGEVDLGDRKSGSHGVSIVDEDGVEEVVELVSVPHAATSRVKTLKGMNTRFISKCYDPDSD